MASGSKKTFIIICVFIVLGVAAVAFFKYYGISETKHSSLRHQKAAPVEVMPIEQGSIELTRVFSGSLEAPAEFIVAPKIGGRVTKLLVDLSDVVNRGQVVAELDDDEYVLAVTQAEADLAVAKANLSEAESALEIANRELERIKKLRQGGVSSESQFDTATANQLAKQAQLEVAKAQVTKAQALLQSSKVRLSYTKISADWSTGADKRVVSERFVEEGDTFSANTPLLSIVELDPINAIIYVTEKDYASLRAGQDATLTTDAFPNEQFEGQISRIAPVFNRATRQAKVELEIGNPEHRLKPGMFIRAAIVLEHVDSTTIVPEVAITTRNDETGVFLVTQDNLSVIWKTVKVGIRANEKVQVFGEGLSGRVVTLGHQLVDDGSAITIPEESAPSGTKS